MTTERSDKDHNSISPLCTYGRHEDFINNKLHLLGASSIILHGVGDGMIAWCALQKRIPIMCIYDKQLHKKTIEDFLTQKIVKKITEASPTDTRWYRTNTQLECREDEEEDPKAAAAKAKAAKNAAAKAAALAAAAEAAAAKAAAAKAAPKGTKKKGKKNKKGPGDDGSEEESSSSSASKNSKTSKTSKKAKTEKDGS